MATTTLQTLIHLAKNEQSLNSWKDVAIALRSIYHFEMTLHDVIEVLVKAYAELLADERFDIGANDSAAKDLVMAPIKGPTALTFLGVTDIKQSFTVEQFYDAFVLHIMSKFRIATINWMNTNSNQASPVQFEISG